jgi:hypothetical protein
MVDVFKALDLPFGATIVREGDEADAFYVLARGSARVVKQTASGDEVSLNVLQRGDPFGEGALLALTTRNATVRASVPVNCWSAQSRSGSYGARAAQGSFDSRSACDRSEHLSQVLPGVGLCHLGNLFRLRDVHAHELRLLVDRQRAILRNVADHHLFASGQQITADVAANKSIAAKDDVFQVLLSWQSN